MSLDIWVALSNAPIFMGNKPVIMLILEGAHSGDGQYAESNLTDRAARASRFGVKICESALYILSKGAASWSAMMYKMFGRLTGPEPLLVLPFPGKFEGLPGAGIELISGDIIYCVTGWVDWAVLGRKMLQRTTEYATHKGLVKGPT